MSINVTVNGKPISFTKTKGKMVTCEQDTEFNLRRKIRLQQVRQQSKEIAAEVRNRVKQERSKQYSSIEHQTENDLKKFQERKLNTLQKHYDECNREIGAAHKNAALEKDPAQVLNEITKKNTKSAHVRLKTAIETKAKEEQQRQNKVELLAKQRKYSKEIEKTRANLVVAINKQHTPSKVNRSSKKRKKKSVTNLNDTCHSDIENSASPTLRRRSPIKPTKSSPGKWKKTSEMKSQPPIKLLQHEKPQKPQKSQKPEISKEKKIIFDQEVLSVYDEPEWEVQQSKFDIKSTQTENTEKHLKTDNKLSREEIPEINIECPPKKNPCTVCFHIQSTQTENSEKPLKTIGKFPREDISKIDIECLQKKNSCPVCFHIQSTQTEISEEPPKTVGKFPREDISKTDVECPQKENPCPSCSTQTEKHIRLVDFENPEIENNRGKNKCDLGCRKRVISSTKDDLIYEHDTYPCFSPLPHDRSILYPTSPPTPTKCALHCSSSSSGSKELSKEEIKKLIDEHRPMDYKSTKISDRIRQRSDQLFEDIPELKRKPANVGDARKLQMKNIPIVDIPGVQEKTRDTSKLPYVPKTTLKSKFTMCNIPQPQTTKAKYYDHAKHFSKTYVPPASVQKLGKDSVDVDTSIESTENENFLQNMCTQEQRAKVRGNKALKRAQIQQDYKQLMGELPVLQRQERLAAMRSHNPEFHMTDERLHQVERRRQNRIENIFEKYYHKSKTLETPAITIRPVQKPSPDEEMKLPFTALDVSEEPESINVGQWKSENTTSQRSKSVRAAESHSTRKSSSGGNKFQCFVDSSIPETSELIDEECRQKCLAELLQRLNKQRELLLQEVQNLPASSNLQKILQLTDDSSSSTLKGKFVSVSTSPVSSESRKQKSVKKRTSSPKEKQKRRQKHKEKKLTVFKNDEGTQTSPNIAKKSSPNVSRKSTTVKEKPTKDIPQESKDDINDDKLCEIIIKMCDESKVKISTQPIGSGDKKYEEKVLPPQKQLNCDISSSTSYLSPPIVCPKLVEQTERSRSDYKDILYEKPKQTNIGSFPKPDHIKRHSISKQKIVKPHTPTKIINPQLLNYIKKLLSMSRKSIDDLTVSSTSDVLSPSPQIVESQHNNPFIQLQNVMNYYNLTFADIQNQLSQSTSSATKSDKNTCNTNVEIEQLNTGDVSPNSDDVDYSDILTKYQEVTKTCVDKISTLTLMIDKIRAEKENILSPLSVDYNENTLTSYLELPSQKNQDSPVQDVNNSKNCTTSTSGGSNKSSSLTQEEIDRYFLEIGPPKIDIQETFVPMLKGIPKYNDATSKLVKQVNESVNPKTRPPASLAQNVQRYNLNIDMVPHELSTIVELDTATNSKNISEQRPKSPEEHVPIRDSDTHHQSKDSTSTSNSGFITISPEQDASPKQRPRKSPRSKTTKTSSKQQLSGSPSDNTSSSSPENFENILRTMGLGWAISTLKKTQEALALSSSSSSSDSTLRKHVSLNNTDTCDITLKDVLNREFLKKLSSSSCSSDSQNLQELQDISDIAGGTLNKDRSTQRTSTPVHQSKSTESKSNLFASVSDVSSVRQHSDEMFLSIPDISLDTNRSLK